MTVYIVSESTYEHDCWEIEKVFLTKEAAEKFVKEKAADFDFYDKPYFGITEKEVE